MEDRGEEHYVELANWSGRKGIGKGMYVNLALKCQLFCDKSAPYSDSGVRGIWGEPLSSSTIVIVGVGVGVGVIII